MNQQTIQTIAEAIGQLRVLQYHCFRLAEIGLFTRAELQRLLGAAEVALDWARAYGRVFPEQAREGLREALEYLSRAQTAAQVSPEWPEVAPRFAELRRFCESWDPLA